MAGKITDYPPMTLLKSGDLIDVSDFDGVATYTSKSLDYDDLITSLEGDITFRNIYSNDGTLSGNRIVSMGVNDLTFGSTGDVNLLRFDSTSDRIGIGTAAPTEKLEVVGNVKISSDLQVAKQAFIGIADTGQSVAFDFKNVDAKVYALRLQDSAGGFLMNIRESGNTSFGTTADLGARLGVSGNAYVTGRIGIGTAAPLSKLDVEGGVAIGTAYSGATAAPTNGAIIEGNVGIGTTTPSDKLEVSGNLNATRYKVNGVAGANFTGAVTNITVVDGLVTAVS